jgi:hypothetical protein
MTDTKTPAGRLAPVPPEFQRELPLTDAHTFGEGLIKTYARAQTEAERDAALDAIGDFARVLTWIVAPLAQRACGNPAGTSADSLVRKWAEELKNFRRPWVHMHPADFPKDPDREQQILDAVEGVALSQTPADAPGKEGSVMDTKSFQFTPEESAKLCDAVYALSGEFGDSFAMLEMRCTVYVHDGKRHADLAWRSYTEQTGHSRESLTGRGALEDTLASKCDPVRLRNEADKLEAKARQLRATAERRAE